MDANVTLNICEQKVLSFIELLKGGREREGERGRELVI